MNKNLKLACQSILTVFVLASATVLADTPTDQFDASGTAILAEAFYGEGGVLTSADDPSFSNTSYLVIDWNDGRSSITYGYRWSTQGVTGEQLFADVVRGTLNNPNDEELYSKQQTFFFGVPSTAIQSIGYNRDGDADFGDLSDGTPQADFTSGDGILGGTDAVDGVTAFDLDDSYAEGFFGTGGSWNFSVSNGNPFDGTGGWADARTGVTDRLLTDNSWDGWSFGVPDFSADLGQAGDGFRPRASLVPEPSSMLLLTMGGLVIAARRRRA